MERHVYYNSLVLEGGDRGLCLLHLVTGLGIIR